MSRSHRAPFYKGKVRYFQKYHNRRERKLARAHLHHGRYEDAEGRITSKANYDIVDWVLNPYRIVGRPELLKILSRK